MAGTSILASPTASGVGDGASGMPANMGASPSGMLSMVGTPIGNLGDLTARAAETFRAADVICCEDTRVTSKLLSHLGISKPLLRCDDNVIGRRAPELVERVLAGERIAFASDAGMPSVSDPGQVLVELARNEGAPVEVIPGPSACVTALVLSGIPSDQFFFEGFLPRRHGERVRRLQRLAAIPVRSSSTSRPIAPSIRSSRSPRCSRSAWSRSAASSPSSTRKFCARPRPSCSSGCVSVANSRARW